jgi:uncharacterized protein YfaS (alpha-2-macroglobulin family)
VSLTDTNARGEVPVLGNLVFRFNKAIVPDSLLNRWDSIPYVQFEPAIRGRFRWEHPDELVFSPAGPLAPATSYKATLSKNLLAHNAYDKVVTDKPIEFSSPDLRLEQTQMTWVLSDGKAVPQVDLYFNYAVNPAALKDKAIVEVAGAAKEYSVQTLQQDSRVSIRIQGLPADDRDLSATLRIAQGLVPEGGKNPTREPIEEGFTIPSPYHLTINGVESSHDGLSASVKVFTSQQVAAEGLKGFLQLTPAAKFAVEPEEDGFRITGEGMDADKAYTLLIRQGLRGILGGTLKEDYSGDIAFGELEPSIRFGNGKATYLLVQGNRNIEVRITNTPKVRVLVSKIYESNLLAAHKYGYSPRVAGSYDDDYYYDGEGSAVLGDVIYDQEIDTRTLPKYGAGQLFNFTVADRIPDLKGMYHLSIRSAEDYWIRDNRFISLSDIGLIAREGQDAIQVFAHSLKSAASLEGVQVSVYGANNQLLGMGATGADGAAKITYARKEFSGFKPAMVIAKTASDFNYLPFHSTRVNTSRFDVGGKAWNVTGLDTYVYAERDIYRPGERINANVLVRAADWTSPGQLPIKCKLLMPNGRELKSFRRTLNDQGSAEINVDLPASTLTGSYQLEVYSGNDVLMASRSFSVEEFVPDRIRVAARLGKNVLKPGDTTSLQIEAQNFFGPPAANRNYEMELQFKQEVFAPSKYRRYDFSLANQSSFFDKLLREGKTDAEGRAKESLSVPELYKNRGLLRASVYATVFDDQGRPVSRMTTADVYTQDRFFGIGADGYDYYPLNQAVRFPLVALDREGRPQQASAKVRVVKHDYRTVLSKSGGFFRYDSQKEEKLMKEDAINVSGDNTAYAFTPRQPGEYELRVYLPGADAYVSRRFYSYGAWGGDATSFDVNSEGQIDIETDRQEYVSGDKVKLLFKTPFSGRMLVTMETNKVLSYQYVDVSLRSATVDLPLGPEHLPNVYVTATLFKPHGVSDIPLTVAHGFKSVRVSQQDRKMDVRITAQTTSRSRTKQQVRITAAPNSYVTLAAVDNGVLQVSDMKSPDPYAYFYAPRKLAVEGFDLYPLLFPELRPRVSITGGDMSEMAKRTNPIPNKRVKIMSYWSGVQKTDGSGQASFTVDIPQFSGEVRLMAVAYRDQRFGAAEGKITVADPVVISTGLPRFLSPGDTVTVPVTLTNSTQKSMAGTATLSLRGPLQVIGSVSKDVTMAAGAETSVLFSVAAQQKIDAGKISVNVKTSGAEFIEETDITVRPPSTLQRESGSGSIQAGTAQSIRIPIDRFMPGSAGYRLVVSKSPVMEFGEQLRYLVQYPFGCTEQTVSAAFPQLYYPDLAEAMNRGRKGTAAAVQHVQEAIRVIKMRQLYNGGLLLWEGEGQAHWWTTSYAAHFLLEARKAGFDVDNSLLETMLGYLSSRLKTRETIEYVYNRDQKKKIAPKEVAYSLYVLALAHRPNMSVMNYYKANPALLSLDARYLLATAYALSGDRKSFAATLPTAFAGEKSIAETGGSFHSDVRDEAIALNMLLDVDPANPQVPIMAKHVSAYLATRPWLSTQERSFALLALGKVARNAVSSDIAADVRAGGKTVARFTGPELVVDQGQLGKDALDIAARGTGRLYYYWVAEGISATGAYKSEDSYLKVRRQYLTKAGQPVSGNRFRQNELIIVRVTVEKTFPTPVSNVVITDLLPAGFEVENPRTKELPGMDWIRDAAVPVALDIRDDRVHFFVDLNTGKQVYYYAVRAVSPGSYQVGPVSADAMYNGEFHSYNGAGTVTVVR